MASALMVRSLAKKQQGRRLFADGLPFPEAFP
jgi:hypothetical protein